jgi:UDP-galactopyranose mutase
MFSGLKYLVVGSGLYGAVAAERIASVTGERVLVLEKRQQVGGNCQSELDPETGIEIHTYGSHIFHTSNERVWNYINQFVSFTDYRHHVQTMYKGRVFPMPISLATINSFWGTALSPQEAQVRIQQEVADAGIVEPTNLEEKAISLIGKSLYEAFIKGYTAKQWEKDPRDLPADIITRLPVRFNYNTTYFNDRWQGVPAEGYFAIFQNLLRSPLIEVRTGVDFEDVRHLVPADCVVIYTGMLDAYFHHQFGQLEWRSLRFETERVPVTDFQGCTVMNYADQDVPWTRIHEFKHYNPERRDAFESPSTIVCREYPQTWRAGLEAYYPINNTRNRELCQRYQELAAKTPNLIMGGRLGAYQYWDMDKAIAHALDMVDRLLQI